jgi:hypothetical protein
MISSKGISKKTSSTALDFNRLRDEGIELIQALSGDEWTDFNIHDPGVTTLEVLCYGLTDLGYRTELLQEALKNEALTETDFVEKYFFKPEDVIGNLPITKWDFEDFTEKNHPQVLLAWFEEYPIFSSGSVVEGGYEIAVLLKHDAQFENLNNDVIHVPLESVNTTLEVIFFDHENKRLNWNGIKKIGDCKWDQQGSDNFFVFENYNCQISLLLEVIYENRTQTEFLKAKARVTLSKEQKVRRRNESIELYKDAIIAKLESSEFLDALAYTLRKESYKTSILRDIKQTLLPCRNLCEDFISLRVVNEQDIKIDAEIILNDYAPHASAMINKIYDHLDTFLLGLVYQSKRPLADKRSILYGSNLIEEMVRIEGVEAARILSLNLFIDGVPTISLKDETSFECISLQRFSYYAPKISREKSNITFIRSNVQEKPGEVVARERSAYRHVPRETPEEAPSVQKKTQMLDRSFFESLHEYHSIQKDFPENYRLNEKLLFDKVPDPLTARTIQFKSYLLFFERIMIDYLDRLYHFNDLLSLKQKAESAEDELTRLKKYLPEINRLNLIDEQLWHDMLSSSTDVRMQLMRKHKILDHLLARFAMTYTSVNPEENDVDELTSALDVKISLLKDIPIITRERGLGLPIRQQEDVWNGQLLSGFQKRMYGLLGLKQEFRRHIQLSKAKGKEPSGFYLVEHILLIKKDDNNILNKKFNSAADLLYDYIINMSKEYRQHPSYSYQLTIVFPSWYTTWRSQKNRIENLIRDEMPAHILPYFHWLNKKNMSEFESCYEDWLEALLQINA